jgi:flagellar hook protein FlgE
MSGRNEDGTIEELGQIGLVKFLNPEGLLAVGNNFLKKLQHLENMCQNKMYQIPDMGQCFKAF